MRDPNAKTLVNKALADEMRAFASRARKAQRGSSGSTPAVAVNESGGAESSPPSSPTP